MSKYACPNCESENVMRFSVAYQEGTRQIDARIYQVGVQGNEWGAAVGKAKGTSQSLQAMNVAPPEKKKIASYLIDGIFGLFFVPSFVAVIPFFVLTKIIGHSFKMRPSVVSAFLLTLYVLAVIWYCVYFAKHFYKRIQWNRNVYPRLYDDWQHTYYCRRCGTVFRV